MLVPTPYSLSQQSPPVLVFEQIIDNGQAFYQQKRAHLWLRFSNTGIGNPDLDYWVGCMKNRDGMIYDRYEIKFRVYTEYLGRFAGYSPVDLSDGSFDSTSTVTAKHYDPPDVATAGADANKYLDTQDTTVNTYHQETHNGTEPASVAAYMDAVRNPFEEWAREFDDLFYWGI